jgi:hypothetical protein
MPKLKYIKANSTQQSGKINLQQPINYDDNFPIFSLAKLQAGKYCLSELDQKNKAMFAEAIFRRKSLTWNQIKQQHRHKLGTEKIAKKIIKNAPLPKFITDDFEYFLAFRYNGYCPMVGYRQRDVFFVLWFDHDFTLYSH